MTEWQLDWLEKPRATSAETLASRLFINAAIVIDALGKLMNAVLMQDQPGLTTILSWFKGDLRADDFLAEMQFRGWKQP